MTPATLATDALAEGPRTEGRALSGPAGDDTAWRTLVVFSAYRVVLVVGLAGAYAFLNSIFQLGIQQPGLAVSTLVAYAVASVLLVIPALLREPRISLQVTAAVFIDVLAICLLMHTSGGIRSGIGVTLLISLAAAGLITRGRLVFFHAAVAAIAVLVEQAFQVWRFDAPASDFLQSGLTSMALFATAGLGWTLARYARTSETIAQQRTVDLANLSQINELVIRDMQNGVLVVDPEGTIRQSNPRAVQLLGPLPVGRRPLLAEYSPDIARLQEAWRRGPQSSYAPFRSPRSGADLSVHFVAIGSGEPPPTVVFIEDVARLRAQAQQMKLVALGRLTASIAHEIRNPLSSINHAAELLSESEHEQTGDERLLAIIRENVHRLDRIVEEVLYLNRRDRAQTEKIDAAAFLPQFVADFSDAEKVPAGTIGLSVRTESPVVFDRQHLHQVLWNLMRNAWRYCQRRPGSIRVSLAPTEAPGLLGLEVADDGPGVAADDQAHLFEPFFTTEAKGTGLGLYIARELCEGNGARIEYRDGGPGGRFRIVLKGSPCARRQCSSSTTRPTSASCWWSPSRAWGSTPTAPRAWRRRSRRSSAARTTSPSRTCACPTARDSTCCATSPSTTATRPWR
jgi:two-component system sensor histidine kinase PilS (NtrC family)